MKNLSDQIRELVENSPGLTDREITDVLRGPNSPQQPINSTARRMAAQGVLVRQLRPEGKLGNYPTHAALAPSPTQPAPAREVAHNGGLSEDELKAHLCTWLDTQGWATTVAWGRNHGVDIEAVRDGQRWLIEVKGCGSLNPMRVNYFLGILGETLQRMDDPQAQYSIALPDLQQYRNLWARLPQLAKQRTTITALFVDNEGRVAEARD